MANILEKKVYTFDAENEILGRIATRVAVVLQGKDNPNFRRNKVAPYEIIVKNCNKVKVTGNKLKEKKYYRHSSYPGGLREITLGDLLKKDSREALKSAVYGMLPKNRSRHTLIKNVVFHK